MGWLAGQTHAHPTMGHDSASCCTNPCACLQMLLNLAEAAQLRQKIDNMFNGEHINSTEDRAVLHVATRARRDQVRHAADCMNAWPCEVSVLGSFPCAVMTMPRLISTLLIPHYLAHTFNARSMPIEFVGTMHLHFMCSHAVRAPCCAPRLCRKSLWTARTLCPRCGRCWTRSRASLRRCDCVCMHFCQRQYTAGAA